MTPLIAFLIQEALQYGPEFIAKLVAIIQKPDATIAEVEALFQTVKPYSSYGIPDKVPVA